MTQNPDNSVTITPSAAQYVCQNSRLELTAGSSSASAGVATTFTWTANGLSGTASGDKYAVSTTATGDGSFTVKASASGYCTVESDPVDVSVSALSGRISTEQPYVCEDGDTGKSTELSLALTKTNADALTQTIVWSKDGAQIGGESGETLTVTSKGSYKATITTAKNGVKVCESSADFPVSGDALKMGAEKTWDEICSGNAISLEGQADGADATTTYEWTDESGAVVGTAKRLRQDNVETEIPNDMLTFVFTARKNACTGTQIHHITVKPYVSFEVTDVPDVCKGDRKTVRVSPIAPQGGATYTWSDGAHTASGDSYTLPSASPKASQEIHVNGSASGYCDSDVQREYKFDYSVSALTLTIDFPSSYCPDDAVNLGANVRQEGTSDPLTYTWYENGTELGENSSSIETTPAGDVTYRVVVTNGICEEEKSQTVKMTVTDIQAVEDEVSSCPGDEITLRVELGDATSKVVWTKEPLDGGASEQKGSGVVLKDSPESDAVYTASLTNGECRNEAVIYVTMWPVPSIDTVVTVDNPKMVEILPSGGTSPYDYAIDGDGPSDYQTGAIFNGVKLGRHTAYVKDENGCRTSYVFETEALPVEFPMYFTPNGDGLNDVWNPKNIDIFERVELVIYDRFGKEVFRTHDPLEGWDGLYLGKRLPSTDYWYLLHIEETGKRYTGHFTLIN